MPTSMPLWRSNLYQQKNKKRNNSTTPFKRSAFESFFTTIFYNAVENTIGNLLYYIACSE